MCNASVTDETEGAFGPLTSDGARIPFGGSIGPGGEVTLTAEQRRVLGLVEDDQDDDLETTFGDCDDDEARALEDTASGFCLACGWLDRPADVGSHDCGRLPVHVDFDNAGVVIMAGALHVSGPKWTKRRTPLRRDEVLRRCPRFDDIYHAEGSPLCRWCK